MVSAGNRTPCGRLKRLPRQSKKHNKRKCRQHLLTVGSHYHVRALLARSSSKSHSLRDLDPFLILSTPLIRLNIPLDKIKQTLDKTVRFARPLFGARKSGRFIDTPFRFLSIPPPLFQSLRALTHHGRRQRQAWASWRR